MKTCATCKHWRGTDATYTAPCGLEGNAVGTVAFAFGCKAWEGKTRAKGGTFITTGPMKPIFGDTSGNETMTITPINGLVTIGPTSLTVGEIAPSMGVLLSIDDIAKLAAIRLDDLPSMLSNVAQQDLETVFTSLLEKAEKAEKATKVLQATTKLTT